MLGGTRILEGAATAASVPSILGFIAFATAGDAAARGRSTARFEAATLGGILGGFVLAGLLFPLLGPGVFLLNGLLYAGSFAIYKLGVPKDAEPPPHPDQGVRGSAALKRYGKILVGSHVWLLAPTWIAINATLGLFTSATLFQLVNQPDPKFSDQLLMGGLSPALASVGLAIGGILFFVGIFWWGRRFASMRRTTIIFYGILGGAALLVAAFGINHSGDLSPSCRCCWPSSRSAGCSSSPGPRRRRSACSPTSPRRIPDDRGAIMGLYSVFLGMGQILGAIVGGIAAQAWGLDGIFAVALVMLGIALLPLGQLRRHEHFVVGRPASFGEA